MELLMGTHCTLYSRALGNKGQPEVCSSLAKIIIRWKSWLAFLFLQNLGFPPKPWTSNAVPIPFPASVPSSRRLFSISTPPPFQCSHCHLRSISNSVGQVPYVNRKRWHCHRGRGHVCPWSDPEDTLKTATEWHIQSQSSHIPGSHPLQKVYEETLTEHETTTAHSGTARPLSWREMSPTDDTQSQTKGTIPGPVGALLFGMPLCFGIPENAYLDLTLLELAASNRCSFKNMKRNAYW